MVSAPTLDQVQQRMAAFEEFMRWRELMLRRFADPALDQDHSESTENHSAPPDVSADAKPCTQQEEERTHGTEQDDSDVMNLRTVQRAILRHPLAMQAGYRALVAEGRRFAQTPDGRQWKERIEGTTTLDSMRTLFEALSLTMVDDDPDAILPSAFLELFVRSASSERLDDIASELGLPFLQSATAVTDQDKAGGEPQGGAS